MTLYNKILRAIFDNARYNDFACNDNDSARASYNAAEIAAFVRVLNMIGHDAEEGSWNDNGCDRFAYLKVDGVIFCRNSEFTKEFYEALES